jgi:hypothetical protein
VCRTRNLLKCYTYVDLLDAPEPVFILLHFLASLMYFLRRLLHFFLVLILKHTTTFVYGFQLIYIYMYLCYITFIIIILLHYVVILCWMTLGDHGITYLIVVLLCSIMLLCIP